MKKYLALCPNIPSENNLILDAIDFDKVKIISQYIK